VVVRFAAGQPELGVVHRQRLTQRGRLNAEAPEWGSLPTLAVMGVRGHRLAVDFGTSATVAMLRWPDGRVRPLLFDGSPLLPSAVFAAPEGMLVGTDAQHRARARPDLFEPTPKQRIDDTTVLLGEHEVPVADLIAAVLARVLAEAVRTVSATPQEMVLTCPAAWGSTRRGTLLEAATRAGMPPPRLIDEPSAAASAFTMGPAALQVGATALIYDFGAGTFDASVVRRTIDGYQVLAAAGLSDAGGLDVDAAIVAHLDTVHSASDPAAWARLTSPTTPDDRRWHRQLWDDVRRAKEMLSRTSSTEIYLPLLGVDAPLGRDELDALADPIVRRTVSAAQDVLRTAHIAPGGLGAVYLVGGSSRMPLVSTALHRTLGQAPHTVEHPEMVVAEGALAETRNPEPAPVPPPRMAGPPPGSPPPDRRSQWTFGKRLVAFGIAVLLAIAGAVARNIRHSDDANTTTSKPACGRALAYLGASTGPNADATAQIRNAVALAVQKYGAANPGCGVRLDTLDSQGVPSPAETVARTLANRTDVLGVVGPLFDGEIAQAGALLNSAGLPFLVPFTTTSGLADHGWETFHRVIPDDTAEGRAIAVYVRDELHANRVALLSDGESATLASTVRAELGAAVVYPAAISPSEPNYTGVARTVASMRADAVVYLGSYRLGAPLLRRLRAGGVRAAFVGNSSMDNHGFIDGAGAVNAEGAVVTCPCTPQESTTDDFAAQYRAAFGVEPGPFSAAAYDAAGIVLAGVAKGVKDRAGMRRFLDNYRGRGVGGQYRFQRDGELDRSVVGVWLYQVRSGAFTPLGRRPAK
jgi:ABC-type branched-subunit amino acid transport system substrate-binding protein